MNILAPQSFDLVIAGGGIVGTACAMVCSRAGLRVALVERELLGSGSTAAGIGYIVMMDDSESQFSLTRRSQQLWHQLSASLPAQAEFSNCGTVWGASDNDEFAESVALDKLPLNRRCLAMARNRPRRSGYHHGPGHGGIAGGSLHRQKKQTLR
jgi:glycine/D-amino acid oxidase-like deaminating enzyme